MAMTPTRPIKTTTMMMMMKPMTLAMTLMYTDAGR